MAARSVSSRPKRSKPELQQDLQMISTELFQEKEAANPKEAEVTKIKEAEIKKAVADVGIEGITQNIAKLGVDVSRTLSGLSEKLISQVQLLSTVQDAVTLERKELEQLHKKDVIATSLDLLLQGYQTKEGELENEMNRKQEAWQQERTQKEKEQKEFDDNLKKARLREKEEYEYQLALERKKEQDQYEEKTHEQDRKNKEKQETLEKDWTLREAILKEKEVEFVRLQKEVSEFPERSKKETERVAKESIKETEQKYQQQLLLAQKDVESEKKISELRIFSLDEMVRRQVDQITALQAELSLAKKQVQDIAEKAIEGASGAKALSHINQIAMEQAKPRNTQA